MARVLGLQKGVIYGPVDSRRLGRSLGINLSAIDYKVCSFNCVYCHYGRTEIKSLQTDRSSVPSAADVLKAVEESLKACPNIDYVTFSGTLTSLHMLVYDDIE